MVRALVRRIVAVVVAVAALLLFAPDRLSGEPTAGAPTTSPATNLFPLRSSPPNALSLYPHRPGAKYEEVEARPHKSATLDFSTLTVVRWTIEPRRALPGLSVPANLKTYEALGLVDGYVPNSNATTGDLLHVVVREQPALFALSCVATLTNGTVLVPYDRPPPRPVSSTTANLDAPANVDLYLPIGAYHGRAFLTCRTSFFTAAFGDRRAVWGLDV